MRFSASCRFPVDAEDAEGAIIERWVLSVLIVIRLPD